MNIPDCAVATTIHSLSNSTIKQYSITYKLWWAFCRKTNSSPFEGQVGKVLTFLQNILDNGQNIYGSFNAHRSALSLILPGKIGDDPSLKRFLKGVFKLRPPKPRYNVTWNPQPVLEYLERTPVYSLKHLSYKLVWPQLLANVSKQFP